MSDKKLKNIFTLDLLNIDESGIVTQISHDSNSTRQRLLEMGLTIGTKVQVIRFAPLGDPIEISLRGYRLSLRKNEAHGILIQKD
ncbi:MAG: FeoA family protein [Bacteroidota bacterium]